MAVHHQPITLNRRVVGRVGRGEWGAPHHLLAGAARAASHQWLARQGWRTMFHTVILC